MSETKLPPLNQVDKDLHLGKSFETTINPTHCKHELKAITSTEARCTKCSAGWSGENIELLVNASRQGT